MIFRRAGASDLPRVAPLLAGDPGCALTADRFRHRLRNREYRAEWTWIAEEVARKDPAKPLAAVAIWWGRSPDTVPSALDGLFVADQESSADRIRLAADLLTAAHEVFACAGADRPPDYHLLLPADSHVRLDAVAAVDLRPYAAQHAA